MSDGAMQIPPMAEEAKSQGGGHGRGKAADMAYAVGRYLDEPDAFP